MNQPIWTIHIKRFLHNTTQFYIQFCKGNKQCSTQLPFIANQKNEWKQTEQMDNKILVISTATALNFFFLNSVQQFLDFRHKL
jgi:hypothetical protein